MAKAGRKRKQGRRTASGQLSRAGIPSYDKGNERAQAMQALYGQDGCDAIGRAYRAGLLGEGNEAKALLDLARALSNAYWATYASGKITCSIGDKTGGAVVDIDDARTLKREKWLNACLAHVGSMGDRYRLAFDQLVIDINPDCGPQWLDRIITGRPEMAAASIDLHRAVTALRQLTT